MPPFFTGAFVTFGIASAMGAAVTGRLVLLTLPLLWAVVTTLLATLLAGEHERGSFLDRYLAGWLDRLYHLGCAWEHIRAGSPRFLWEGLILEERLDALFPAEPLQGWSNVLAAIVVALFGVAMVAQ